MGYCWLWDPRRRDAATSPMTASTSTATTRLPVLEPVEVLAGRTPWPLGPSNGLKVAVSSSTADAAEQTFASAAP